MREKGTRDPEKRQETTRDERVKVIALRDAAGMSWTEIGKKLNMNRRTAQRVSHHNLRIST